MDPTAFQKPEYVCFVQFSFGDTLTPGSLSRRCEIGDLKYGWSKGGKNGLITFTTQGGISNNLKCLTDFSSNKHDQLQPEHGKRDLRLTPEEGVFLKGLASLTRHKTKEQAVRVSLQLLLENNDFKAHTDGKLIGHDELFRILPGSEDAEIAFTNVPYRQYRHPSSLVAAQHNQMLPCSEVLQDDHPGLPYDVLSVYCDAEEALVVHANGSALLHEKVVLYLKSLSKCLHQARFVGIRSRTDNRQTLAPPVHRHFHARGREERHPSSY